MYSIWQLLLVSANEMKDGFFDLNDADLVIIDGGVIAALAVACKCEEEGARLLLSFF